jgi:hypothetical protein
MMGEVVEERGRLLGVARPTGPMAKRQIGGDDDGSALVEPADRRDAPLRMRQASWRSAVRNARDSRSCRRGQSAADVRPQSRRPNNTSLRKMKAGNITPPGCMLAALIGLGARDDARPSSSQ